MAERSPTQPPEWTTWLAVTVNGEGTLLVRDLVTGDTSDRIETAERAVSEWTEEMRVAVEKLYEAFA